MIQRLSEHFEKALPTGFVNAVSAIPPKLYKQERDWTCSVACLRSIASKYKDLGSEDEIVSKYGMDHGPYYAHELISCGLLDEFDYETTSVKPNPFNDLQRVYKLLAGGATVMVETCKSFDHWLVLLAYFPNGCEFTEDHSVLMWDPYYNETLLMRASEFCDEWLSGEWASNNILCDFLAIKGLKEQKSEYGVSPCGFHLL